MRLKRFDTSKIKVRGGGSRGARTAGGLGCGTIIIALIGAAIFGVNPAQMIGMVEGIQGQGGGPQVQQQGSAESEQALCTSHQYATETCNALTSLNETWKPIFSDSPRPILNGWINK